MDQATGLTYMQQRYYDPQIGRFLSVDPMTTSMDTGWNFNRYNYAANNPYRFTDPDGRVRQEFGAWIGSMWRHSGDMAKVNADMDAFRQEKGRHAELLVDMTSLGIVKDAVVVTVEVSKGNDATAKASGALAGEAASRATEKTLKGKVAGEILGVVVGKVVGTGVEAAVQPAPKPRETPANKPVDPPKPPKRETREISHELII